jgi:tRNA1(Val) A37 N6-methylase TrmN6
MLSRLKFDISVLVEEILDQLPKSVWTSTTTTFLDPAIGGGQFVAMIEQRLRDAGHSDENIASRVFGYEDNQMRINFTVNKYKLKGTYTVKKFIEEKINMKFDVAVGNPPFQKADNDAARWVLWIEFVKKSKELADIVAMITPQSITSPGPISLIQSSCEVLNVDVSKHFNVGSTFCYFILNKHRENNLTRIITDSEVIEKDISSLPFLPSTINQETLEQLDFLMNRKKRVWKRGELHTSKKSIFTETGKYKVMHTNAQELATNTTHQNLTKIRVAVSLSGYPKFCVIQDQYVSQACFWTEFDTLDKAIAFADECNGDFIQQIMHNFKWSGWNSKEVIQCL